MYTRMKKLLPLLLLGIVVAFAGCVGQPTTTGAVTCAGAGVTNGIVISDFSFDFNEIYGGEAVGLTFTAENMGGTNGTLIDAEVFGPDINDTLGGNSTELQWGGQNLTISMNENLDAPNTELDIPGGMYTNVWTFEAPTGLGAEAGYDFNIRTKYSYETNFVGVLTVMSSSYLRSLPEDERKALIQAGGLSQQCHSGGPIALAAAAGTHFVDPNNAVKRIRFKVTNVGDGYPYYNSTGGTKITSGVMYKVNLKSASGLTCTGVDNITLSRGQIGTFSCTFKTPTPTNKKDITFTLTLNYNYWLDKSTFIKVLRPL